MKKPLDDLTNTCKYFFDITPYDYQIKIMNAIFSPKKRKITIRATTRAGKSYTLAMAAILYAIFNDNRRIGIVARSFDKAQYIMEYIAMFLSSNQIFDQIVMVDAKAMTRLERLRKEVSKRKITLLNGTSIEIKSADVNRGGFGVMGAGYDLVLIEETSEITPTAYSKIYRMLVESPETLMVEIGNPWNLDHFYDHHNDPEWEKIHIHWKDCVKVGRITNEAIEDQRKQLTDLEFKVLFEANFPEEVEFAVFSKEAIENATEERPLPEKIDKYLIGADIAVGGRDSTVLTIIIKSGKVYYFKDYIEMDTRDSSLIAGKISEIADKLGKDNCFITVDTVGVGHGVKDMLGSQNYNVDGFVAGNKARRFNRFYNKKAEAIFGIADLFKEKRFFNLPRNSRYVLQLRSWIYERILDKRLRVLDPSDKSPDHADSLLYSLSSEIYDDYVKPRYSVEPKRSSITQKPIMRGYRKR